MKKVNSWRPSDWENNKFHECMRLTKGGGSYSDIYEVFDAGADAMHKVDISWLIERITHDDRGYVFNMTDKEWQEFIK